MNIVVCRVELVFKGAWVQFLLGNHMACLLFVSVKDAAGLEDTDRWILETLVQELVISMKYETNKANEKSTQSN